MVIGYEVTAKGEAHSVNVVVVNGDRVVETDVWPAPAGEDEATALQELAVRCADLIAKHQAAGIALWRYEAPPRGSMKMETARAKLRAEGVLLMAAAQRGVTAVEVVPSSERSAVTPSTNEQLVRETSAGLVGAVPLRTHGRAATAAALGSP